MKNLLDAWKRVFVKYFDVNQNGKVDKFEIFIIIMIISIYNTFFQVFGNYIYDLLKK